LTGSSTPSCGGDGADRAFCGTQLLTLAPLLAAHGVAVWRPEVAEPVDLADPAHGSVVLPIGAQAMRELQRARFRTTAAMVVQAREQGRYLGGRPPYGYRLCPSRKQRRPQPEPLMREGVDDTHGRLQELVLSEVEGGTVRRDGRLPVPDLFAGVPRIGRGNARPRSSAVTPDGH
jgi:hypothetical protein